MQIGNCLNSLLEAWPDPAFAGELKRIEDCPDSKGIYLILIQLHERTEVMRPRPSTLAAGLYCYAGSAFGPGGLKARIKRHLKPEKSVRWHIDQVTLKANELWAFGWNEASECDLVAELEKRTQATHPIPKFGSTDCRTCRSHFLRINHEPPLLLGRRNN